MDAYIATIVLDLAKAIKEDNLDTTQEKVRILNENIDKITTDIDDLITSNHGNISLNNESFNYVLENALFFNSAKLYQLRRKVRRLLLDDNEEEISNFIIEIISKDKLEFKGIEAFYEDLILLTNQINNETIFEMVKNYLESQVN